MIRIIGYLCYLGGCVLFFVGTCLMWYDEELL